MPPGDRPLTPARSQDVAAQENVWDYPRPPAVEPERRVARVEVDGVVVAESGRALRVLETSHPPAIYIPREDVRADLLSPSSARQTVCEWKGRATYLDVAGRRAAAWTYEAPFSAYEAIRGHLSFYPDRVDACWLGDERVRAQGGGFYGGWVTSELLGPFKA